MNIAEVSKKFGLTADTLRYYERIGLLPAVARNKSGNRDYSSIDCERIEFIKCMREAGLSIEVLTRYMHLFLEGDSTLKEREELLIAERDRLESRLAHALFSVPAVKGIEFGKGFALTQMPGSKANDQMYYDNGVVKTYTNNNGGITGGITKGTPGGFLEIAFSQEGS